ncbi:hypothetical protein CYLTODRAFT_442186 [Cylindrobasidium torrendii FP15055 ss-10]|uniref:MFS general substrate transporter n=1 Tax=Cylindrobasidium torrendii FP15055 ss-10 TaxID=1314674 RepID=A0A0D7BJC7_9AGAR|nr:hypothetical protein CYLTODRAFT_442186 [Cylindrobasidium torrendii FP15055 ss-10]
MGFFSRKPVGKSPAESAVQRSSQDSKDASDAEKDAALVPELNRDKDPAVVDTAREQDEGVTKIEALYLVFGKGWKLWMLWISMGLINYVYTLSSGTTYTYLQYATSAYSEHTFLGTISVATAIITGVSKPFLAKLADLSSRPMALSVSVGLFTIGYIIIAASKSVNAVAAGEIIYTPGSTGLDFLTSVLMADITSLQWRAFVVSFVSSMPWILNVWISTYITTGISANTTDGWRWGFGMFAIMVPVCIAPVLFILFWGDRRAKKLGALSLAASGYNVRKQLRPDEEVSSKAQVWWDTLKKIDAMGLLLIGGVFATLLIPFTLYTEADHGFKNPSIIAMFVVAGVLMIATVLWEWKVTAHPIMPRRVLNRSLICSVVIDFFYYLSGYLSGTYYSSWVYIIRNDWSLSTYTYYTYVDTLVLCSFGIVAGLIQRYTHRYKYLQLSGLAIRIIGQGLQYYSLSNPSTAVLVMHKFISCMGGSFSVVGSQVATQASVPHQDMAIAMAILSLWTSIGGSIGSAISAAVWNDLVPKHLEKYVGDTFNATERADIFGSIVVAKTAEPHNLINKAYTDAMRPLFLAALITSCVPLVAGMMTTNFYLGEQHNAMENKEIKMRNAEETTEEAIKAKLAAAEAKVAEKQ